MIGVLKLFDVRESELCMNEKSFEYNVTGFRKLKIRIFMQMRGAGFWDVDTFWDYQSTRRGNNQMVVVNENISSFLQQMRILTLNVFSGPKYLKIQPVLIKKIEEKLANEETISMA